MGQFIVNFKTKEDLKSSNQKSVNAQKKAINVSGKTKQQVKAN